jgi:hypothetical protein
MRALLILAAVVTVMVGLPLLGIAVRKLLRRPLSPEQVELDKRLDENRRDGRYFWR